MQQLDTDFQVVDYLKENITIDELKDILKKLDKKPYEIIRRQEKYYKTELKNKNFTDDEWIRIMAENPKIIQRPIVVGKYKAIIALPPELILEII